VAGALMAFNPPPPGSRRHNLPTVGVITLAGGIYFTAKALLSRDVRETGNLPRHADRGSTVHDALKLAPRGAVGVVAGAGGLWWYVRSGLFSVLGMAIGALGLMVPVLALGLLQLWSAHRTKR
jgi:hypothetical protein